MTVPKKILRLIHLDAGAQVDLSIRNGKLIFAPKEHPRYTLAELLVRCDAKSWKLTKEDRAWLRSGPMGNEAL